MRMVADAAARLGLGDLSPQPARGGEHGTLDRCDRREAAFRHHGPDRTRDLTSASGLYVRLVDWQVLPEYRQSGSTMLRDRQRIEAWHGLLGDWLETTGALVMNRTKPSNSNMSKPYQAQLVARAGFRVPATIVTNDVKTVRIFQERHRRVVFKSISAQRSIVTEPTPDRLQGLRRIRMLPTQFQELVEGDDVRVHVVGRELFATRIRSEAIDYRYAGDTCDRVLYEPMALPEAIVRRCLDLSHRLDLPLCGIDLKLTAAGEYVCFEVTRRLPSAASRSGPGSR